MEVSSSENTQKFSISRSISIYVSCKMKHTRLHSRRWKKIRSRYFHYLSNTRTGIPKSCREIARLLASCAPYLVSHLLLHKDDHFTRNMLRLVEKSKKYWRGYIIRNICDHLGSTNWSILENITFMKSKPRRSYLPLSFGIIECPCCSEIPSL